MKPNITWELQKYRRMGSLITQFTRLKEHKLSSPLPLPDSCFDVNDDVKIALRLTRHEEAWWIINQSTEYCCTVNDQIVEPHHRMRLE